MQIEAAARLMAGIEMFWDGLAVTIGNILLLPASVSGMGCTAQCEILVRKQITVSRGKVPRFGFTYTDYSIICVPGDLPDGEYRVSFDGFILNATCYRGYWLPHGHARPESDSFLDDRVIAA